MNAESNWRVKTLLIGALIGALTGVGAAYLLVQRAERQGEVPRLDAGEGVKLGMRILGVLRHVAQLGEGSG
jgi:hypothetical protein